MKALSYGNVDPAAGGTVRQKVQIQQGIPQDKAKEVVKFIKDSKAKVQASIQGDVVRVSGKDRDTLQGVIASLESERLRDRHAVFELPIKLRRRLRSAS